MAARGDDLRGGIVGKGPADIVGAAGEAVGGIEASEIEPLVHPVGCGSVELDRSVTFRCP